MLKNIIENSEQIWKNIRWKSGVYCPRCGSIHYYTLSGGNYKCGACGNVFNDFSGTILQNSKLPVWMWLWAIYRLCNDKVVTCQSLATDLGVNIKTAWLLLNKVRYLLKQNQQLSGTISIDEMYFGGSWKSKHRNYKENKMCEDGFLMVKEKYTSEKRALLYESARKRKARIISMVDSNKFCSLIQSTEITTNIINHVVGKYNPEKIVSDEAQIYKNFQNRIIINHNEEKYITINNGNIYSTNNCENRNSWIERIIHGGHVHCKHKYLQLYLNEIAFRMNCTGLSIEERFEKMVELLSANSDAITIKHIKEFDYMVYNGLPTPIGYNRKLYKEDYTRKLNNNEIQVNGSIHSNWWYNTPYFEGKGKSVGKLITPRRKQNSLVNKKYKTTDDLAILEFIKQKDIEELKKQNTAPK